jgi:hypothetical protein
MCLLNLTVKSQQAINKCGLAGIVFWLITHDYANNFRAVFLKSVNHGLIHLSFDVPRVNQQYKAIYHTRKRRSFEIAERRSVNDNFFNSSINFYISAEFSGSGSFSGRKPVVINETYLCLTSWITFVLAWLFFRILTRPYRLEMPNTLCI